MTKRQIAIRALDWGSSAVLALLVLAVVAVLLAPQFTGWRYGILRSGSMSPAMPTGSAIVVEPVGSGDAVHVGDVITFRSRANQGLLITHRVVEVTQENGSVAYRTQGDANNAPDGALVQPEQLVGRVIFDVPKVGLLGRYLDNRTGFLLLIAIPAALIISFELKELWEGIKELIDKGKRKVEA